MVIGDDLDAIRMARHDILDTTGQLTAAAEVVLWIVPPPEFDNETWYAAKPQAKLNPLQLGW